MAGSVEVTLKAAAGRFSAALSRAGFRLWEFRWTAWCVRRGLPRGVWFVSPPLESGDE